MYENEKMKSLLVRMCVIAVTAIVTLIILFSAVGVVPVNHVGIWKRAGVVRETSLGEGWHLKIPFVDSIETMSNLVQTTTVNYAATKETAETKDQQLIVDYLFEIQHQLIPEQSFVVYKNYGKNYEKALIVSNVLPVIKQAFALYNSEEITTNKESIATYVQEEIQKYTSMFGINILRVNFQSYDFTADYDKILEERATLKAQVINEELRQDKERVQAQTDYDVAVKRAEQEAETARIAAENKKEVALLEAERDKQTRLIAANAEAEAAKIEADNQAYVVIKLAEAERDARLASAEATKAELEAEGTKLTDLIVRSRLIEKWDGQLIPTFGSSNGFTFTDLTSVVNSYFMEGMNHGDAD